MPDVIKYILTLIVVLIVMVVFFFLAWAFTRFVAKNGSFNGKGRYINVLERFPVGRDSYLLLVKYFDRILLVGVTAHEMTVIKELDAQDVDLGAYDVKTQNFGEILSSTLESAIPEGKFKDAVGKMLNKRKGGGDGND